MPQLNNALFDAAKILEELKKPSPNSQITTLEKVQKKLKPILFGDSRISNDDVKRKIEDGRFKDFPSLRHVLTEIFNDKDQVKIPEGLKDWSPSVTFHELNHKYGYFEQGQDLTDLFNLFAVSGRKITSIIENQAYDDEMAYKLMALFYDPKKSNDENFENISQKFAKLITTKQDKSIQTPYHDAFVVALHQFPAREDVKELESWKTFIASEGFKSLSIFAECATTRKAFANIKDANEFLLTKQYPRAEEHPELAALCKKLLIKNSGFEAGLAQVKSGWPKKETDNLPLVDIADKSGEYFWVKLPPQDMRAMYLGNLIPGCCQFIDGASIQCVIDGMTLSDNGFYVMLKAKNKDHAKKPRLIGNEVNDKDFSIVAQSYAWKTANGNLCLDSIEWNRARVSTDVIQDLMAQFSEKIFEEDPRIKYLTVGKGGQTPKGLYTHTKFPEKMKQGVLYGDASSQYQISSNIDNIDELTKQLEPFSDEFKQAFLYLAPYFEQPNSALETLLLVNESIETELPRFLSERRVKLPPSLNVNDFKKISFEEYQEKENQLEADISTVCKIVNTSNENEFLKWLPTIPDKDLYLLEVSDDYSLEAKIACAKRLKGKEKVKLIGDLDMLNEAVRSPNASQTLQEILGMLPPDNQLPLINQKNSDNESVLQIAVYNPKSLKAILKPLSTDTRLEAVKQTDGYYEESILHMAVKHPESLKAILELLPESKRLEAVNQKNSDNESVLHWADQHPESLKAILDLLPENMRLEAIKQTDRRGQSVLHMAAYNTESLKVILNTLPKNDRLEAVMQKDTHERSILQRSARYPESLQMILNLYPESKRLKAVKQTDSEGQSVLHAADKSPEILKTILESLPESERLEAVNQSAKKDVSILSIAATQPTLLETIFNCLSSHTRLKAVKQKNKFGASVLHTAVKHPKSLKVILASLLPNTRLNILKQTNNLGMAVLHTAAMRPESVKTILELLPKSEQLEAVKQEDEYGESVLHVATQNSRSAKMIMDLYPEKDRLEAVKQTNKLGASVLHTAAQHTESLKVILELLPENVRLEAVKQANKHGQFVIHRAAQSPESLKVIFELLPKNNLVSVIKTVNPDGKSLFDYACQYPEQIKEILTRIPENQRYPFVTQKNTRGNTHLSKLTPPYSKQINIESLKAILELLPEGKRLDAVQHTVKGTSVLSSAVSDPTILKTILELLPKEQVFKEITTKHKENLSIVGLANKSPELLKFIKSSVLETLQKKPEAHDSDDPHNEARQIIASTFGDSSHQDKHGSDPKPRQ